MNGVVDLATYNKLLTERNRLSNTLKRLQQASQKALEEFNTLREDYDELCNEVDLLKDQNQELRHQLGEAVSRAEQSEQLLQKLTLASRQAITEFNDLKQRFVDEYTRRVELDELVLVMQHKLEESGWKFDHQLGLWVRLKPVMPSQTVGGSANKVMKPASSTTDKLRQNEDRLSKELAKVRVQLSDTMAEFHKFKEHAYQAQVDMDHRIMNEIERLKAMRLSGKSLGKSRDSKMASSPLVSASVERSPTEGTSTRSSLLSEIVTKGPKSLRKSVIMNDKSDPMTTLSRDASVKRSVNALSSYRTGGFSNLGSILAKESPNEDQPQSPPPDVSVSKQPMLPALKRTQSSDRMNRDAESDSETLANSSLPTSPDKPEVSYMTLKRDQALFISPPVLPSAETLTDNEHDTLHAIADKLLQETRLRRERMEKRATRVFSAAGHAPVASEYGNAEKANTAGPRVQQAQVVKKAHVPPRVLDIGALKQGASTGTLPPVPEQQGNNVRPAAPSQPTEPGRQSLQEIEALFGELESELGVKI